MARAIWKGSISFGLVTIPVSIFTAENRAEKLSFHLLDERDMQPIENERLNSSTGKPVEWDNIVRGYEYEQGRWVTLSDDDFRAANVEATQTIDVLGAVCAEDVPVEYYDKPYYLEPSKAGRKAFALLREALRKAGRVGVIKVIIRTRQRLGLLVPEGDALILELIRYPYELRGTDDLDLPTGEAKLLGITAAELKMAGELVKAIEKDWDPTDAAYADTYHDDLLALIKRKAAGETVEKPPIPQEAEATDAIDIMSLLKKSLEEKKVPAKAKA
jgi:DNA end-binding protein Ku